MGFLHLETETILDLMVNVIPIFILVVLDALFWVANPWGWDPWFVFWGHFLTLFPLTLLLILTYVSGRVVQRDEQQDRERLETRDHDA